MRGSRLPARTMTSSPGEGFRFNGVAMIRQWSPSLDEGERTSIRGFLEGSPERNNESRSSRWRTIHRCRRKKKKRRGGETNSTEDNAFTEVKGKRKGERKNEETCDNLIVVFCIRRKVVSPLAHPTMRGTRRTLSLSPCTHPSSSLPLSPPLFFYPFLLRA